MNRVELKYATVLVRNQNDTQVYMAWYLVIDVAHPQRVDLSPIARIGRCQGKRSRVDNPKHHSTRHD